MPVLAEWKKAGKVKYIGVTTSVPSAHPEMLEAMNKHKMDFIQVDYSLGNRASADKVLPLAQRKGVAVLINVPFGGRRGERVLASSAIGSCRTGPRRSARRAGASSSSST